MKDLLIYLFILAFFLSYNKWESVEMGIINLIFSFIFVLVTFLLIKFIFNFIASFYGINVKFDRLFIKKEIKKWSHLKKDIVKKEYILPLDYILTILFGFLTYGLFFPIFFSLKFNVIESKRIGISRDIEIRYEEKIKIYFYSMLLIWMIFSLIKFFKNINPILNAYFVYSYNFLVLFTISSLVPINLLLSYILSEKFGFEYINYSIGDMLLIQKKSRLKAVLITILFLPFLSLILDPLSLFLISLVIFGIVWVREKFKETVP